MYVVFYRGILLSYFNSYEDALFYINEMYKLSIKYDLPEFYIYINLERK